MTFAELRLKNLGVLLDTNRGAEPVTLLLAAGGQAAATALVRPARSQLRDRVDDLVEIDEIDCRLPKTALAGDRPRYGMGLLRSGDDRPYSFAFVIEDAHDSFLLRFERETVRQIGTRQSRSS
jgi:hypothetical protein